MIARHTLHLTCRCPENGRLDSYEITVETNRLILVERIEEAVSMYVGERVYQEQLAEHLAAKLDASVTVSGQHGAVKSVVTCST